MDLWPWIALAIVVVVALVAVRVLGLEVSGRGLTVRRASQERPGPTPRGLTRQRIDVEVELYRAILELRTAQRNFPQAIRVPRDVERDIRTFWLVPEDIGMRPGGEEDVRNLTHRIRESIPPEAEAR